MKRLLSTPLLLLVTYVCAVPAAAQGGSATAAVAATQPHPATAAAQVEARRAVVSRNVILVSIDGLRPDAIEEYGMETLQHLMREGSYSLDAHTILPSKTLPSHTSMLTGENPAGHGITFNSESEEHGVVRVPTIFEIARAHGFHTAGFFSKAKFRHLDRENAYDYRQAPASNTDNWMATRTVPAAIRYMRHKQPNLLFVHIAEPDYAGHAAGWMGFFYGLAVQRGDAAVARVLRAAEETYGAGNFTLLVTADHGGHGKDHGSDDLQDTTIPWIAFGQGVKRGASLAGIRTMDTAATALWLLGLRLPVEAEGRPVAAAFGRQPRTTTAGL